MRHMTKSQATTPIPVQLSGPEFIAFISPHLSMPRRGSKCKLGYHRVFNLILWVLYTGMQSTGCGFLKAGEFGLSRLGPWIPEIGGKMRPEKLSDPRKPRLQRNCITSADFWPF
jgi:hypothetical protein